MRMLEIRLPGITRTKTQGNAASYKIEPLEPGYGVTIAHTLKRILLSSLPGAAVTSIRIEGVSGESQKIPGIQEDLMEVLLNVKQLRFRCTAEHPVSIPFDIRGICELTGANLILPETIELINPGCHLATIDQEYIHLTGELIIQQGTGYVAVNSYREPFSDETGIPIDAIYTPVRKVTYSLEHTRVGKMVNFEKIVLEIETDATITPDEALRKSGEILVQQFLVLARPQRTPREHREVTQSSLSIPQEIYDLPLEQLHLSVRSYNAIKRYSHITKVGQILVMDEEELRCIRNIGDKALLEISDCLQTAGCFPLFHE